MLDPHPTSYLLIQVRVQTSTNKPLEDEDNDEGVDLTDGDLNVTHLDTRLGKYNTF